MQAVTVKNADRMMTVAAVRDGGIHVSFADGAGGAIPFAELPEIDDSSKVKAIELPNPYELVVTDSAGARHEIPWDFARHYCDPSYRPRVEAIAERGRLSLGERVREMRTVAGMTQEQLASAAGIGRVTLVRLESGEQSPRYETLVAIARALGQPVAELLVGPG
jgi:DNA-binding XRE family transcriptional regulator